jgi:succinyl-diaminopimelate desuccinylase
MSNDAVVKLAQQLIRIDSITPDDKGCQNIIKKELESVGFQTSSQKYGAVDNLFAWHGQKPGLSLLFVGHTDVVPVGDKNLWQHPPFSAAIDNNHLYGRGAADMKGAVAAFTLAMKDFVANHPNHNGKIALMLTSDEEGPAVDGIKKFMPLIDKDHKFDYCLVGEPSSKNQLGDEVRIGRRGSLHIDITIHGKQGHIAYPQYASNPIFLAADFIKDLSVHQWDNGNDDFPPTSFQISAVKTSTSVSNIIPADIHIQANFRFCPQSTESSLKAQIIKLLEKYNLNYSLEWNLSGKPFHSKNKQLKLSIQRCIYGITGINTSFNTIGGTSDGRFVAEYGVEVVELGLVNKTIHQINERVLLSDVEKLNDIYYQFISTSLANSTSK